jgi:hypothetical protein
MLAKLHSYGLLDNDTGDIAESLKKKKAILARPLLRRRQVC